MENVAYDMASIHTISIMTRSLLNHWVSLYGVYVRSLKLSRWGLDKQGDIMGLQD